MQRRFRTLLNVTICLCGSLALADDFTLEPVDEAPDDLTAEVAELIDPAGHKIIGPRRDYCEIWLLKELAVAEDFEPELTIQYPLTPGQLVGVMRVPRRSDIADFRGQELDDGVYTLRYGQQPMDGNHIGTSETSDFLMALPVDRDHAPAVIENVDDLNERSSEAAGSNHPAIFSLLPTGDTEIDETSLQHDEDHDFFILQVNAGTPDGASLPLRVIVVGESEG